LTIKASSPACTKRSLHQAQLTPSAACTKRSLHQAQLTPSVAYTKRCLHQAKLGASEKNDALQFDFGSLQPAQGKLRIVGNLPYNISSPLLFHLARYAPLVEDQHFMLQKEVVQRMVAPPGGKDYGRLSVMLQWRYQMEMLFIVPPQAFDPPPKVDSAIVRMRPLASPLACEQVKLEQVVTQAFSQRRKVIRNSLGGLFTEAQLISAGIDPQARPETIALEQYVALTHLC
jgi:16S rRNA (adenine1518-N6/adenine1519-N6)-dimethyltransferase